jgi:hypothetical protein
MGAHSRVVLRHFGPDDGILRPMTTPRDFAVALLSGLGLPLTLNNIAAMVSAQAIEGGFSHNTATYNPLNITQPAKGSSTAQGFGTAANPANIQAYPDWPTALSATIALFKNGLYNDILASFQKSADPQTTLAVWAKNPSYGWTFTPEVNMTYADEPFPQGPSSKPLPSSIFAQAITGPAPALGPNLVSAGIGAVFIFGFWKLYEYLGKY